MRRTINNLISVVFSLIRFSLIKLIRGKSFRFSPIERLSPDVVTDFNKGSKVSIGKMVRAHSGTKLIVRRGGKLSVGDNVSFNYGCILVCRDSITIGEGTEFGPSVYIYDHDHDYKAGLKKKLFLQKPIHIGKNCWIGANTIILRGTDIGNNCVIGAGSVIKGIYPENTVIIQKRETIEKKISV